jgi:putative membrane protein
MFPRMFHGFYPGLGGGEWIALILSMVCFLAIVIGFVVLVVWLVRSGSHNKQGASAPLPPSASGPSAREILQTRYARGEITREQYQEMLADINQPPSS